MKQLAAARAVITIWSPNSIRSDWVRAEAGRAKADGKLIAVKTPDVAYADIPLPFGEMHTENLEASQLIRAAVVAQLAKPTVQPSALALLAKGFRYELLTWIGIVGGALTLFTNASAVLRLADWARLLVQGWKEWMHAFWLSAFGWLGIEIQPYWTPLLSFLLFWSLLTIGQAVQFKSTIKNQPIADKYQGKSFQLISWRTFCCIVVMLTATILLGPWSYSIAMSVPDPIISVFVLQVTRLVLWVIILVLFARHRLHATVAASLMAIFFIIIALVPEHSLLQSGKVVGDIAIPFWLIAVI